MDWIRDHAGISDCDYRKLYKYEQKHTTVIRMMTGDKEPTIYSLETEQEWVAWLESERHSIDGTVSGFILLLAKRTGEPEFCSPCRIGSAEWLERYKKEIPIRSRNQRTSSFATMAEKDSAENESSGGLRGSGRRSIRTLPFSENVFRLITKKFYTHGSISRVISRADVQTFSCSKVDMGESKGSASMSKVYNCRTTNAWDMDLALTATHFLNSGLTFAILFGCPLSVEEEVIRRLSSATAEAAHPLLIPGIFAELERTRHVHVVEAMIDELETKIFEIDFHADETEHSQTSGADKRNREKREAYLDTAYLRNVLISWNMQLSKMLKEAEALEAHEFTQIELPAGASDDFESRPKYDDSNSELALVLINDRKDPASDSSSESASENFSWAVGKQEYISKQRSNQMQRASRKIKDRLEDIIEEYEGKIRDCTMRVDGMTMATQWAHGETNVEIALSTGRDSRHMRSIALLTMVFLPGTFFASVFSMTFFNWSGSNGGGAEVSSYIWIYVLVTVSFTLLTVGIWYYFVIWRQTRSTKLASEEEGRMN